MSHLPPRGGRCPERSHHLAGTATRRNQAPNPLRAGLLLAQTRIEVAAPRAHLLVARTNIPMEVAVPVARDHQAVHPEVGPAHPHRQIWQQLCPRTLPL